MFKKILEAIGTHVSYFRTIYFYPLIGVGLTIAAIYGVPLLTGRAVVDDPGVLVASLYIFCKIILVAAAVDLIQTHLIGFRNKDAKEEKPPLPGTYYEKRFEFFSDLMNDSFDALNTLWLFLLFSYLMWH